MTKKYKHTNNFIVARFIKINDKDYDRETLWKMFSSQIPREEYDNIIDKLHESGKILFDRNGTIVWIWNPRLVKEVLSTGVMWSNKDNT
jgi:hypothetical protein